MFFYIEVRARAMTHDCDDSLIEEVFALMKLRFIIFLHIANRAVYIESTSLYMSDKRRRERKPREKRKESMHSINDSDERAHTLRRYLNDRSANERNVDIQCYVSNNDRQLCIIITNGISTTTVTMISLLYLLNPCYICLSLLRLYFLTKILQYVKIISPMKQNLHTYINIFTFTAHIDIW